MANRWFSLLLGVALLQGVLSFGPIDETSEEWIQYRNMLRDPSYRLTRTTEPVNYEVHLTPHLGEGVNQFTFDGEVSIKIRPVANNVIQIVLHCSNLTIASSSVSVTLDSTATTNPNLITAGQVFTCDPQRSFLRINVGTALQVGQQYIVKMSFTGILQSTMRGFYRSWYNDKDNNRRWMATTQFQPGHARQAFPCYDEPGFKATFDISITRDIEGFNPTISNMPIKETQVIGTAKVKETFHTTPITSTYLLAFIVSGYEQVASNNHDTRPFHIYARGNIPAGSGDYSLRVGAPLLEVMDRYTAIPYYSMNTNMNMKQAAIPDFSAGAMENWGLLTYREALIIYDPENTNNFYKQRIANIISHEIAHMWFGNLVTCAWWDNLWLNEGFARFYQYFLTAKVEPEMGFETRFITEQVHVSLLSDATTSAHPLTDLGVNNPTSVSNHFSTITYAKGACVLRMTQHLLGNDTYVKGLRSYLQARSFNTAEPEHLFNALTTAATTDNAMANYGTITVTQYLTSWTTQSGHPLLTVRVDHTTGDMVVQQTRFFRDSNVAGSSSLWHIPLTWTRGGAPDFVNLKPSQILTAAQAVIPRGTTGNEWVIFNKQQSGFYRVNYDQTTWALITRALRGNDRQLIHEYNRAQIVDDVFVLARANILTYREAFNILSFLKFEDAYAPWLAAITGLNFARRRLAHNSFANSRLRDEIIDMSTAVVARLGYNESANAGTFMDDLLRMHVMTFLCDVGHQNCIAAATTSFRSWRAGGRIPPNMRPWVYCNGLRYGTAEDYDFFWSEYLKSNVANEQVVMITAAGCTQHQPSLNRFLANIAIGSENNFVIRPQDYSTAISSAITGNEANTMRVFHWLQDNIERTKATPGVLNSMLSSITSRLLTTAEVSEVEGWVTANQAILEASAVAVATQGLATSRANIQFYNERVAEFNSYFDTGFEDYLDPTPTTPSTPEPTTESTTAAPTTIDSSTASPTTTEAPTSTSTEPSTASSTTAAPITEPSTPEPTTTPAPDSANLASLSIVTLIVTLVINMA
uniref:Aminopeptidase 8 n=1 Tax=Mamestra configurata TaxID=174822 RepID=F6K6Z9_9NEOP|nr:aminopeptidase 8 [Mamestra configurata]